MLELGAGADILRALGWLYLGLMVLLIVAALWLPTRWWQKVVGVVAVLLVFVGPAYFRSLERSQLVDEHKARYEKAKALFDERCKAAGEKIYRTVEDVEGVLLINVRPRASDSDKFDSNWPDAGLPEQFGGDGYISSFLLLEHHQGSPRGALNSTSSSPFDLPGYRYVDAKGNDGVIWRHRLKQPVGYPLLSKTELKSQPARYAVSYTNLIDPKDREQWIAETTVTVSDTQTSEILARSTWYSFEPGLGSRDGHRTPWLFARSCPELSGGQERAATRFFVDQVLKPKKKD